MPERSLGTFKDPMFERWYLLWRAHHVAAYYQRTVSINIILFLLQFLFSVLRGLMITLDSFFVGLKLEIQKKLLNLFEHQIQPTGQRPVPHRL